MNPDVAAAIERLQADGVLSPDLAGLLRPVARGERVSVRTELRILLYAGVLLATGGVAVLVRENLDRLGPVAVAIGLTLAALLCLGWAVRRGPAYSPGPVESPHLAFDYVLLLGVLLASATLAYVEVQFTPLGDRWPWHFLFVALLAGALSVRYDSRSLFSLALGSLAAWRGVDVSQGAMQRALPGGAPEPLRREALLCGLVFLALGYGFSRGTVKPHFEGVATHFGALLLLGGLLSGCGLNSREELAYAAALLASGVALAAYGAGSRRFSLVTLGILGAYAAAMALMLWLELPATLYLLLFATSALGLLGGLLLVRRHLKENV
ncbi:MAG TPA: DUF2157 domain-containing protein [Vicinamibacteria bacterium]